MTPIWRSKRPSGPPRRISVPRRPPVTHPCGAWPRKLSGVVPSAHDYGVLMASRVTRESLVPVEGNAYSVPLGHVGAPVTVRLHRERVVIWRDTVPLAEHRRAPAGAQRRVIEPAHFTALFARKPRAQVMLYRQALLDLGEPATSYLTEVSCRRRDRLRTEVLSIYAAWQQQGSAALLAAMTTAAQAGASGAEYLTTLLTPQDSPPAATSVSLLFALPGVPAQTEIDRRLSD